MGRAASLDAGHSQVERAREGRQRGGVEHERCPRGASHLETVPQQPEPGHVGRSDDSVGDQDLGGRPVERPHLVDRGLEGLLGGLALAVAADEQPGTEALREQ